LFSSFFLGSSFFSAGTEEAPTGPDDTVAANFGNPSAINYIMILYLFRCFVFNSI
jgi:hypothetical protein